MRSHPDVCARRWILFVSIVFLSWLFGQPSSTLAQKITVRMGHFPNITHAQALVAHALSRQGKGWFEQSLGRDVEIQWYVYNAGPSATEAIFANAIDVTYIGPSPALNAYFRSNGDEIRVVSGAANGGSALVVQADNRIRSIEDFRGRKFATPQLGNTQDVEFRAWLKKQGYKVTQLGGDVKIIPTANPDQLQLFSRGEIDGAWTVEPWVSRLELEAHGKVFFERKNTVTTVLVARAGFLKDRSDLVRRLVRAHQELTNWIKAHPTEAKKLAREELAAITKREVPAEQLERSWNRLQLTNDVSLASFEEFVRDAQDAGFIRTTVDLGRLLMQAK